MSIELDWQIVHEDVPEPQVIPPPVEPRRRWSHKVGLALAGSVLLVAAVIAAYSAWVYRERLDQVREPVRSVAQSEAKAIAANDRASFLAFQDPDDPAWRAMQDKRFGRLERVGLPEFGWTPMGAPPVLGDVSLEPGGVRVDVTYQFSVTQPLPGGPASVTLRAPQFYKPTPSGWVRAMPGADFWGRWRNVNGKHLALTYLERDASLLEPLLPRLDDMLASMCDSLPCPPQPILLVFENSSEALARLSNFSYGFDQEDFMLRLPSPQLFGLPADARSQDELARAIGTRVIQALVYKASGHLNTNYVSSQTLLRWELARAGLTEPFITPAITSALAATLRSGDSYLGLGATSLRLPAIAPSDQARMALALAFIEQRFGINSVARLAPAIGASGRLGGAIQSELDVHPTLLEPAWQGYLREQTSLPIARPAPPTGDLALRCLDAPYLWRIRADGTGLTPIGSVSDSGAWNPIWSPDAKFLVYQQGNTIVVMDADSQEIGTVLDKPIVWEVMRWLPNGWLQTVDYSGKTRLVSLTGEPDVVLTGIQHVWSPDGTRVAYLVLTRTETTQLPTRYLYDVWIADTNGQNASRAAPGIAITWSPDSQRWAFHDPGAADIQIADITHSVSSLVRLPPSQTDDTPISQTMALIWSPTDPLLAVVLGPSSSPQVLVLSAETGDVRVRGRVIGTWAPSHAWSPDGRYLVLLTPTPAWTERIVSLLDVRTGAHATLPGIDTDWSPDARWLAVLQADGDLLFITPDLAATRSLSTPNCYSVVWRPTDR